MANIKYRDDAFTTIVGSVAAIDTGIVVASNTSFSSLISGGSDHFFVTLKKATSGAKETVKVTANPNTTWTIVRAQGYGESALTFTTGDSVSLRVGANLLDGYPQDDDLSASTGAALIGISAGGHLQTHVTAAQAHIATIISTSGAGAVGRTGGGTVQTALNRTPFMFATVAAAQAATDLVSGNVICLADRASSLWDLSSSGTANGWNVIFLTASGLYATLRVERRNVYLDALGAAGDDVTDDTAAIQAAFDLGGNIISTYGKTYLFGSQVTPTVAFNLYHYGTFKCKDAYATNGYMFSVSDLSDGVVRGSGTFDGNLAGQNITTTTDDKQICFRMIGSSSNWKFKKGLKYKNWGKDAIYLGTTGQTNIEIDGYFENIRRYGVTVIAGTDIKVRGQHRLGKDQTNVVFNAAVTWEPNNSSQHITGLDISVQCRDMQNGVTIWNANGANQEGINIHHCGFNTITQSAAIIVYACGNTPVQVNNNYGVDCGITSTDSISTEAGGIGHRNSNIQGTGNVWENCGGYRATVANNGSAGKGTKYTNNTHINDKRRAIYQGYVFGTSSEPSMRNFSHNTLLGGGTDAANTYPAIEIVNTTSHNGSHDICEHNTIRISTSSGYNAGVVVDYDDGSSTYARNKIFGTTGTKYTFTNGNPRVSGDETRGSVTLSAAATTTVTNANTQATSKVVLVPTNAAAATLMSGSKALYVSARTANTSFVLSTADATSAAGTETFDWYLN